MGTILPTTRSTLPLDRVITNHLPPSETDANRKLKVHRKSRRGCGNCKLRRVKVGKPPQFSSPFSNPAWDSDSSRRLQCDESKPRCKKCTTFGVFCNYDGQYSDLQLSVSGAANIETLQILPHSLKQTIPSPVAPLSRIRSTGSLESRKAIYDFREQDLELLNKFQTRTVYTITTEKNLQFYQKETIKLAYSVRILRLGSGELH